MNRINSLQAARSHRPAAISALLRVILHRDRRSGAEKAQGGGDCKRYESLFSTHDSFLHLLRSIEAIAPAHNTAASTRIDLLNQIAAR
jgi:hypothetical protein